jgi:hypothetical protein
MYSAVLRTFPASLRDSVRICSRISSAVWNRTAGSIASAFLKNSRNARVRLGACWSIGVASSVAMQ